LEVYIDDKIAPKMKAVDKILDMVLNMVKKKSKSIEPDIYMTALTEGYIDPDDYLRFRLTRRFDNIARTLYEAHHKPQEETDGVIVEILKEQLDKYEDTLEKTGSEEEAKLAVLADQIGVDYKKIPDGEKQSLLSMFGRSKFARFFKKRK